MGRVTSLIERFDRSIVSGTWRQLAWFASFIVILVAIFLGIAIIFDLSIFGESNSWWEKLQGILYHLFDPGNQSLERDQPWASQLFTFIISLAGLIFLGGMLLSTLINSIERRVQRVEQGLVVYTKLKDHYVIIGYGAMIINVIDEIFESSLPGYKLCSDRKLVKMSLPRIVVMTNQSVIQVRSDIHSQIMADIENNVLIYAGDIESREHLSKLNISSAKEVYILGERGEYGRDTKNIACVDIISDLRGATYESNILPVNVQFNRIPSYSIAQKINIPKEYITHKGGQEPCIYFRPFNFHENWARLIWGYYSDPKDGYSPLDYEPMVGDKHVHLVIVGLNRMGRALLLEALRLCHYANYNSHSRENTTQITVIDMSMDEKREFFEAQHPHIATQIEDIQINYLNARIESPEARALIKRVAEQKSALLTVAICIKDPDVGMATGLNLPEELYYQREYVTLNEKYVDKNSMRPRVLIRQELHKGLGVILDKDDKKYANVKIFGMLNKGLNYKLLDDRMAMYVNRNYNQLVSGRKKSSTEAYGDIKADVETGKNSGMKEWLTLSENYRWANRYQIDMYGYYLRTFQENQITKVSEIDTKLSGALLQSLAEVEHRRWAAERTLSGWRKCRDGESRIEEFLIHNLIIPYSKLIGKEREKDYYPIKNVMILDKIFKEKYW